MHSADHIVDEWQQGTVGDAFRLHPDIALHVVVVEPDRALVVQGVPMGDTAPPYDSTWAFVLTELADGNARLVIRERCTYSRRWAALIVKPVTTVSFVMTRKMLHGISARADGRHPAANDPRAPTPPDPSANDVLLPGVYTSTGCHWEPERTSCDSAAERSKRSPRVFTSAPGAICITRPWRS